MKTAVQIAIESIKNDYEFHGRLRPAFVFEQLNKAEIDERQQIINAWENGEDNWLSSPNIPDSNVMYKDGEKYYDETFGK